LDLKLAPRIVSGDHLNQGKAAILFGPLVLAADESLLDGTRPPFPALALTNTDPRMLALTPETAPADWKTWPGAHLYRINATRRDGGAAFTTPLVPFADAGRTGARYKVWLPLAGQREANVLLYGSESRSRPGNLAGSINDDNLASGAVTFDGQPAPEDWFAVTLPAPADIRRIIFVQGTLFHDGGWFAGAPKFQVQREPGGAWETLGVPIGYPVTTTTDHGKLQAGWQLKLRLKEPVKAVAVRVIGVPAGGDNPHQAFASCAELQAFSY
jgi:hypothetical protein